ncbi:hypothetical protein COD67_01840 [Bacillus cereus]|nr:hypothetical protein COI89_06505 [Bacillus cereus]PGU70831.1 hypothetical protein COD67_01840 [Bacillus cereus]
MAGFLISYKDIDDPNFGEFTYGSSHEGRRLKTLNKGDILFFHTMVHKKRCITAYIVIEMVLSVEEARSNKFIKEKYKNPHLLKEQNERDEVIVFGNPIFSRVLDMPLQLQKSLLLQLSRKPNFNNEQTYQDSMTSALRTMKELNDADIDLLLFHIKECQKKSCLTDTLLSSEEVQQVKESDIEKFLIQQHRLLDSNTVFLKNQYVLPSGKRLDILLQKSDGGGYIIVEIKKGDIGRDDINQLKGYIKELKVEKNTKEVKGIMVCKGVLPYFENDINYLSSELIEICTYAWKFSLLKRDNSN